jgi:hypothetical protein
MASEESRKRYERRRFQQWLEQWCADPAVQALRREIAARQRYRQRHPFSGRHPGLLRMHCIVAGATYGAGAATRTTLHQAAGNPALLE